MNVYDKSESRELNNRILSLQVDINNLETDHRKIEKNKVENELRLRRIKKDLERLRMEREQITERELKNDKKLYSIEAELKGLKKKLQQKLAERRML